MIRNTEELLGFTLGAVDGEIGRIRDIYFEDRHWAVRYLVADTKKWLPGRKVLLHPPAVKGIDEENKIVRFDLTREQIRQSPSIEEDMPVSRQYEVRYFQHYNWPVYWEGAGIWGPMPGTMPPLREEKDDLPSLENTGDPHLRSVREIVGYTAAGADNDIGKIDDVLFDDQRWMLRYLVVGTGTILPGRKVLIPMDWVSKMSFERSRVDTGITCELAKTAPEYESGKRLTREFETLTYDH